MTALDMSNPDYSSDSEPEEINDLRSKEVETKYRDAAKIVNKALQGVMIKVRPARSFHGVARRWKEGFRPLRLR